MANWTVGSIPAQGGRVVVVTGSSSGIGEKAAEALAGRGARTVLAVRDPGRGAAARERILRRHPKADVAVALVDLGDLASIRAFADRAAIDLPRIDCLINNAGLGMQRDRATTVDGFERQLAVNHLGAFALTGLLLPNLLRTPAPRVVAVASIAHRSGRMDFEDLQSVRYDGGRAYSQSKLADLLFALELDRRARRAGLPLTSLAAHPGIAATGFVAAIGLPAWQNRIAGIGMRIVGQSAAGGAAPLVYAAAMPDVAGGEYWGPDGFMEIRGLPAPAKLAPKARDGSVAARLWAESERLTGVRYAAFDTRN